MSVEPAVVVCVKWTTLRAEVDPLLVTVHSDVRRSGFSDADRSAVELALQMGSVRSLPVVALTVGPGEADDSLRDLLAVGVSRAVRVDSGDQLHSREIAAALADALRRCALDARAVVCGDVSADRGSGAVPAFLAHELGVAQALGLLEVDDTEVGSLCATRRLDGARRERLSVQLPAVMSVEGGVADLRRASLSSVLATRAAEVEVLDAPVAGHGQGHEEHLRAWRPRPRVVPAPVGERALERIVALTGALVERTPPRTVALEPADAADAILDQLRVWGYLEAATSEPVADVVERSDEPPLLG